MMRWRYLIGILILLAILSLFLTVGVKSGLTGFSHVNEQSPLPAAVNASLAELPSWVSSLATFVTLLLFGSAIFYILPARVRNLQAALTVSWMRSFNITLAGLAFGLLFVVHPTKRSLRSLPYRNRKLFIAGRNTVGVPTTFGLR